ncbi:hypothetical protein PSU4_25660 [Pseudonocardia sulfidoxydans NBRC 16205]|uniref:Transcriptional repressor n=2 Tax=Pseudonocardia sulfidoxydans TaxID=54011 RepID=A0A511DFR2_9PSEU|nr:hypothetical protein PSU4_25660 [Pseudonocardia sulfidoxydans NBRC 16205]
MRMERHRLVCRECGETAHVDQVPGIAAHLDPAHAAGYRVEAAVVVFRGLCASCRGADREVGVGGRARR